MIGRTVTIERGAFDHNNYVGKKATIVAVIRCFVIVDIEGVGYRGCLIDYVQVVPTAADFGVTA